MVRKVLLVGSSGNVGCATVAALGTKYTDIVRATAGTRKPDSEESKSKLDRDNVSRVKADSTLSPSLLHSHVWRERDKSRF